jgi:hypothetical protein
MFLAAPLLGALGASAATAASVSGIMSAVGSIASVASAVGAFASGNQQQAMYDAQAKQAQLRAQAEELKYKQQGVAVLQRTNMTAAAIAARAGAGSVDPFSGSASDLTSYAFGQGFGEFNMTATNAALAREQGVAQAGIYRMMGQQAYTAGIAKGIGGIFSGLMSASSIGGAPTGDMGLGGFSSQAGLDAYMANPILPPVRPF